MKKRLAIIGCGKLGNIVMDAYVNGMLPEYEMVGVLGRNGEHAKKWRINVDVRCVKIWKNC